MTNIPDKEQVRQDTLDELKQKVLEALRIHLQHSFYPPLPSAYAEPAYEALLNVSNDEYSELVTLPDNLNPLPAKAQYSDDEGWTIRSGTLFEILRLDGHKFGNWLEAITLLSHSGTDDTPQGYNGCEVHLKPEGRCPSDGQECSFAWYD